MNDFLISESFARQSEQELKSNSRHKSIGPNFGWNGWAVLLVQSFINDRPVFKPHIATVVILVDHCVLPPMLFERLRSLTFQRLAVIKFVDAVFAILSSVGASRFLSCFGTDNCLKEEIEYKMTKGHRKVDY